MMEDVDEGTISTESKIETLWEVGGQVKKEGRGAENKRKDEQIPRMCIVLNRICIILKPNRIEKCRYTLHILEPPESQ